jgi:hypothetical protein
MSTLPSYPYKYLENLRLSLFLSSTMLPHSAYLPYYVRMWQHDVTLEDRHQPFQIHHQNIGLGLPNLHNCEKKISMILKLPGLLYFLTEEQTNQDMQSSRVVMLL